VDPHEERLLRNEEIFRRVNERLRGLGESFSMVSERASFVCECADANCAEQVELTLGEYAHVRADPATFLVLPGHERPEIERVVLVTDRYLIVEKPAEKPAGD
jgi:hypothetical protein